MKQRLGKGGEVDEDEKGDGHAAIKEKSRPSSDDEKINYSERKI
jgi:hypothetical protein